MVLSIYRYWMFSIFTFYCLTLNAQKLPNIQPNSLWASADIKVDGKATVWNNQFQAYNTVTQVFYTLCNDNDNLYLILQASDAIVIRNKIMKGGVTFVIQKGSKKTDKNAISITYPVFEKGAYPKLYLNSKWDNLPSAVPADKYNDTAMLLNNHNLAAIAKTIQVSGIADVDTIISIYNNENIRAFGSFDIKRNYICKISISLLHLGLSAQDTKPFLYHILLNGGTSKYAPRQVVIAGAINSDGSRMPQSQTDKVNMLLSNLNDTYLTTDFWGKYTLAKRP